MANQGGQTGQSGVNFQSEAGNVDFQSDQGAGGIVSKVTEAAQNVNWNKVAVGAGAVAAVAGAAVVAKKYMGGSSDEDSGEKGNG